MSRRARPEKTAIKFCGMTIPEDAGYAAELGASYVGVIFAESPRKVNEDTARAVFDAAGPDTRHVAVFGSESASDIAAKAVRVGADVVQLHGQLDSGQIEALRRDFPGDIWVVVSIDLNTGHIPQTAFDLAANADAILLDARVGDRSGGTGRTLAWHALTDDAASLAGKCPIILAGGLTPENVSEAIILMKPSVVDVSSGVEASPGVKDRPRMKAFAEAVHAASIVG